jgi:hypothetical protein
LIESGNETAGVLHLLELFAIHDASPRRWLAHPLSAGPKAHCGASPILGYQIDFKLFKA